MKTVWLFSKNPNHGWKWLHVTIHREVIEESPAYFEGYESCLASAKQNGYVFQPSHGNKIDYQVRRLRPARQS